MLGSFVIGIDFGTDSVRAVLVNAINGQEVSKANFEYPIWKTGAYCDPRVQQFRQHPKDHVEGLEFTVKQVLRTSKINPLEVKGICIDTTGSSPLPINSDGIPLAFLEKYSNDPDAMLILWKDHTAIDEAEEITQLAKEWNGPDVTKYVGGVYSPEWFWAKILHIIRSNERIKKSAYTWMEHCDYLTYLISDQKDLITFKRSRCGAGHKAMWHTNWNGLPPLAFLKQLDPYLSTLRKQLYEHAYTSTEIAGNLNKTWAKKLGLSQECVVAVGTFDAHAGAVGAGISSNTLVKVMGTSTCDMMVTKLDHNNEPIEGICGQVFGSILPDYIGLEAGQSAFGDVLAWYKRILTWPLDILAKKQPELHLTLIEFKQNLLNELTKQFENTEYINDVPIALDWVNGRRSPDANQELKSAIQGLSLGTDATHLFYSLILAICFGSKKIVERFLEKGLPIKKVIGIGGVARKSPLTMQTLSDVLQKPVEVVKSDETPALGAAIYAAVASGIYSSIDQAIGVMSSPVEKIYYPNKKNASILNDKYQEYIGLAEFVEIKSLEKPKTRIKTPYKQLQEQCYEANMQLNELELVVYTFGNVSAIDRDKGAFAIKPSGVPYDQLRPKDIVIVDLNNQVIVGNMRPSSDTKTHTFLYNHWETIGGIAHTHATYSVSWAQAQRDIPIFGTTHADHLTNDIPCAPPMKSHLIEGNYEHNTGIQIVDFFQEKQLSPDVVQMVLIGNHGPFTWGKNAQKAVYNSRILEELAKMAYLTLQLNPKAKRLKKALINKHYDRKHGENAYYGQNK